MDLFLCQLENNADFPVRSVTISKFGQGDRVIPALTTIVTQFQPGPKVMLSFRADTGDLVEFHGIMVSRSSGFKLFPTQAILQAPDEGTPIDISGS